MCQINNPDYSFAMQGWECPKCGKVYSPYQYECTRCGQQQYEFEFGSPHTGDPLPNDFVTISTSHVDESLGSGTVMNKQTPHTLTGGG